MLNRLNPAIEPSDWTPPLVVDLDGTVVCSDLLVESFFAMITRNLLYIFAVPFWLLKGKAYLKDQISRRVTLDVITLPYNQQLIDHLTEQRSKGRRIILATASDHRIARQVADHLQLFDMVLASDGETNLSGKNKRDRLVAEFGERNFDYIGDNMRDLAVWSSARRAILVNPSRGLSGRVGRVAEIERVFENRREWLKYHAQALRLHHWLKNLLVFVPIAMAHRWTETRLLMDSVLAFFAFSFCASSVYLINDIVDIRSDRRHPWKQLRPFASGRLSIFWGGASIPLLLGMSVLLSLPLPRPFLEVLIAYFLLNLTYSFALKRIIMLDVVIIAALYTTRIMAGSAAVAIWPSPWLLAFSVFLFFSLSLVKRYAELVNMTPLRCEMVEIWNYRCPDKEIIAALGAGSGCVAVLVLGVYIASGAAHVFYARHDFLWLLCPLLLYWISHLWLIAHRGEMREDPLVYTVKDQISRIIFAAAAIILVFTK